MLQFVTHTHTREEEEQGSRGEDEVKICYWCCNFKSGPEGNNLSGDLEQGQYTFVNFLVTMCAT